MKQKWLNDTLKDVQKRLDSIGSWLNDCRLEARKEEKQQENVSGIRGSKHINVAMGYLEAAIYELEQAIHKGDGKE